MFFCVPGKLLNLINFNHAVYWILALICTSRSFFHNQRFKQTIYQSLIVWNWKAVIVSITQSLKMQCFFFDSNKVKMKLSFTFNSVRRGLKICKQPICKQPGKSPINTSYIIITFQLSLLYIRCHLDVMISWFSVYLWKTGRSA